MEIKKELIDRKNEERVFRVGVDSLMPIVHIV